MEAVIKWYWRKVLAINQKLVMDVGSVVGLDSETASRSTVDDRTTERLSESVRILNPGFDLMPWPGTSIFELLPKASISVVLCCLPLLLDWHPAVRCG
jgi:hypothetical protein